MPYFAYHVKLAHNIEEALKLVEVGFRVRHRRIP